MNQRSPLSVTLITFNEEQNIRRALESVSFADEVVVVDSGSQDKTVEIAKSYGAKVFVNPWPGYGQQKNYAQKLATHDWVLNLDADECVPESLKIEILGLLGKEGPFVGFRVPRKTFYLGRWIKHGGWYPNYLVRLARKSQSRWTEPAVHEEWKVEGSVGTLTEALEHYTFSNIQDQIHTNLKFSKLGSEELQKRGQKRSLVKLLIKPVGKFFETYLIKGGFLDGLPGFIISVNAAHSMFLKYAYLFEPELCGPKSNPAKGKS